MRIVKSIATPLAGERIVGIDPAFVPETAAGWRRRLNLFAGRSLSDVALTVEQEGRAGRLATRGQLVSPGVVTGLEIGIERVVDPGAETARFLLQIAAGYGLAPSGEDVVVPRTLRVGLRDLPVHAPAALLDRVDGAGGADGPGAAAARRIGPPLGDLIAAEGELPPPGLPRAGVVVLQPVVAEVVGTFDPTDQCEEDPESFAFEDWLQVDGCRVVFSLWPDELLPLPPANDLWRNRLAHAIFEVERRLAARQVLPWAEAGVPIALIGFDAAWAPVFADRFAVVRAGGKPRTRSPILAGAGTPFLWQARMQQLAEQLTDPANAALSTDRLADQIRYLPPAGLLPRDAIDLRTEPRRVHFFPARYAVSAVPAPLEQLDLAIEASASLAPFDTFTPDEVEILVPVPEIWYEPRLLQIEAVDPEFQQTIDEFVGRRGRWLARRLDIRAKASAVGRAITGAARAFPDPDPDQLEPEQVAGDPIDPTDDLLQDPEAAYGTTAVEGVLTVDILERLRTDLRTRTPLKSETSEALAALPAGLSFPTSLVDRIRFDDAANRLIVQGVMTAAERDGLLALSTDQPYRSAVERLFTRSQDDDLARLDQVGLEQFVTYLEGKVGRANDTIDFGFLRVQTDVYRLRQLMLGNQGGTRLATSPALATIAQGETAAATRENINSYFEAARNRPITPSFAAAAPESGTGGGAGPAGAAPTPGATFTTRATLLGDVSLPGGAGSSIGVPKAPGGSAGGLGGISTGLSGAISGGFTIGTEIQVEGAEAVGKVPLADVLRIEAVPGTAKLFQTQATADDVIEQSPIVGKALDFRTVTVAERLQQPAAPEAKNYTVASKFEVVSGLANLDIAIDDLQVPGFRSDGVEVTRDFRSIREGNLAAEILQGQHDPDPADGDEAAFFAVGVRAVENATATLRVIEGRVQSYRIAIQLCRTALGALRSLAAEIDRRLAIIGDQVAEARHDVSVARALLAEETQRVAGINGRRDRIVAEHVTFLAYRRPRTTDLLVDAPVRPLDPGVTEDPVPACLERDVATPPELRAFVDLFREAPVRWLPDLPPLLERLDRPEILRGTIQTAKVRAQVLLPTVQSVGPAPVTEGSFSRSLGTILTAQQQVVARNRALTAQVDLGALTAQSWTAIRDRAQEILSIGDLIDGRHGRSDVAREAARRLDDIAHVATCLYAQFGQVLPVIRLDWAERLSQFDAPLNLRDLTALPRWGEIDQLDRRDMQTLTDWLYQRVDPRQPETAGLVNDLIRVCILLASHAPVTQILAGHVARPTTVRPGSRIDLGVLTAHLPKVRIGMQVLMYSGSQVVARGVVEDLGAGQAGTRVVQTVGAEVQLAQGATAQFAESDAFDRSPLVGAKTPASLRSPGARP